MLFMNRGEHSHSPTEAAIPTVKIEYVVPAEPATMAKAAEVAAPPELAVSPEASEPADVAAPPELAVSPEASEPAQVAGPPERAVSPEASEPAQVATPPERAAPPEASEPAEVAAPPERAVSPEAPEPAEAPMPAEATAMAGPYQRMALIGIGGGKRRGNTGRPNDAGLRRGQAAGDVPDRHKGNGQGGDNGLPNTYCHSLSPVVVRRLSSLEATWTAGNGALMAVTPHGFVTRRYRWPGRTGKKVDDTSGLRCFMKLWSRVAEAVSRVVACWGLRQGSGVATRAMIVSTAPSAAGVAHLRRHRERQRRGVRHVALIEVYAPIGTV